MGFMHIESVAWAVVACLLALAVARHIYRVRRSPLAKVPNAGYLAPYSRLGWLFLHENRGTITLDLPPLHDELGPLIRIGPREVSFYSLEVYNTVHKVGRKFKKDPRVYGEFVQDGHPALFSITDPAEHSKRRRLMGQLFNRSKMDNLEGLMLHHINQWVAAIAKKTDMVVDLAAACRALEADIISDFSFGATIGAIDAWSHGRQLGMVAKNDEKATWMPILTTLPTIVQLWEWAEAAVFSIAGYQSSYTQELQNFHKWANQSWSAAISRDAKPSPNPNLVQTLVRSGLPPLTALSEAKENLGPGTDTTSASLAHVLWALAHNGQFQEELFDDLSKSGFPTDMTSLESVAKLSACVHEGIRWAGAAAAMLPRIVPEGGVELHGTFIPEGTVLTSSPIWYLRDKTAFPSPEYYDPYRWLTSDGTEISEDALRDRFYIPFSKGANVCMGIHFSYYELYLSVSRVICNYRIHVHEVGPYAGARSGMVSGVKWQRVKLPSRKEWVAAVVTDELEVIMEPRGIK
ncbi:benzoate 4-monooxygenase cytochrome p450 [Whalleya microplaca]|nr:benzoate 4-monooxygenase cytochrome p450 [Whalleya microplaca]